MFSRSYATPSGARSFGRYRKLRKEIMDLKQQLNKLEEENRILRGITAKNITSAPPKKET